MHDLRVGASTSLTNETEHKTLPMKSEVAKLTRVRSYAKSKNVSYVNVWLRNCEITTYTSKSTALKCDQCIVLAIIISNRHFFGNTKVLKAEK